MKFRPGLPSFPEAEPRSAFRVDRRPHLGVSDEQAFILGYHRCSRNRDFGSRSIAELVELQSDYYPATAGFLVATVLDVDPFI